MKDSLFLHTKHVCTSHAHTTLQVKGERKCCAKHESFLLNFSWKGTAPTAQGKGINYCKMNFAQHGLSPLPCAQNMHQQISNPAQTYRRKKKIKCPNFESRQISMYAAFCILLMCLHLMHSNNWSVMLATLTAPKSKAFQFWNQIASHMWHIVVYMQHLLSCNNWIWKYQSPG